MSGTLRVSIKADSRFKAYSSRIRTGRRRTWRAWTDVGSADNGANSDEARPAPGTGSVKERFRSAMVAFDGTLFGVGGIGTVGEGGYGLIEFRGRKVIFRSGDGVSLAGDCAYALFPTSIAVSSEMGGGGNGCTLHQIIWYLT